MARSTTAVLTGQFTDSSIISGSNFSDVFDSTLNLEDIGTKNISGSIDIIAGGLTASSSIARGSWSDGYLGNSGSIAILPSDFTLGNITNTTDNQQTTVDNLYSDSDGGSAKMPNASDSVNWYAMKIIPKGFKATSFQLNGSAPAATVDSFSASIDVPSTKALTSGTPMGIPGLFPDNILGDGITYAIIAFNTNALNDEVYGGQINIERM